MLDIQNLDLKNLSKEESQKVLDQLEFDLNKFDNQKVMKKIGMGAGIEMTEKGIAESKIRRLKRRIKLM